MTDVAVVPSFNTGSDHRLVRGRFHFGCGLMCLTSIRSRQPCPTILDEDAVTRLAKEESFEVMDDVDANYEYHVQTVTATASSCRSVAPTHSSRCISASARALLEKRRNMNRQENHIEYTLLSGLCRQRIAEDRTNFARSKLLDEADNRRSLRKARRKIAEHRLRIPCLKTATGTRCCSIPGMEEILTTFYSALFKSDLPVASKEKTAMEETLHFLSSELRHAIETMPRGKATGKDGISVELLQACGPPLYRALARRYTWRRVRFQRRGSSFRRCCCSRRATKKI
ncbi:hypothetical protein V3C99_014864 [Haemonchus contortus]|uniref:Endonuclease-reverse transcriptase n=1 Tax=Haemonchus contortus TaxID=6289 RepID=A0A7I4YST1_HAECO